MALLSETERYCDPVVFLTDIPYSPERTGCWYVWLEDIEPLPENLALHQWSEKTQSSTATEDPVPAKQPTVASDLKVTPQARRVLKHLREHGTISPMEALIVLGVSRLASCIYELRAKAGYSIDIEQRKDDAGHRYGRYFLRQPTLVH